MYIYLIKRDNLAEYDETVAAVIVAKSYGDARELAATTVGDQDNATAWTLENADITLLGEARGNVKPGVVLSEFRAG